MKGEYRQEVDLFLYAHGKIFYYTAEEIAIRCEVRLVSVLRYLQCDTAAGRNWKKYGMRTRDLQGNITKAKRWAVKQYTPSGWEKFKKHMNSTVFKK
jgi:hypothetical protein